VEGHRGHRQRLRESFMAGGAKAMPEHQLLELLLTYAIPRQDVNPIAHELMARYGSLAAVLRADIAELKSVDGIGENAAVLISLAGAMRGISEKPRKKQRLDNPEKAANYCARLLKPHKYEAMYLVSLDSGLKPVHEDLVSSGTIDQSTVYPRIIAECALRHAAAYAMLCHNHPSGNSSPSGEDIAMTKTIFSALSGIGIQLYDHIIVGESSAYSMARGVSVPLNEERNCEETEEISNEQH
jgi:DNA repair protein RadC